MAGELAASSAAVGRVNAQEKVGCWCTTVEGIKAEGEAIIFGVKMIVQLSKLSFKLLSHYAYGGCTSSSSARRLHPLRLGAFASACSTGYGKL